MRADSSTANIADRVFVGREPEMAELRAALASAIDGSGRLLLLIGEAGIGKTRLADVLAGEAAAQGVEVVWGRCWEGAGAPSYWPWVQILRALRRSRGADQLTAPLGAAAIDLAALLPELAPAGAAAAAPMEGEQARFRLFDATSNALRGAAAAVPLLLVLDDLHWSDPPSLLLLQFVARELRDAALLVVATYRDTDVHLRTDIAAPLGELARDGRRLFLAGLSAADVAAFINHSADGGAAAAVAEAVHRATDGNPFFVDEVVHLLAAEGRLGDATARPGTLPIPDGVRDAVRRRLDPLPEATRTLLATAAVIGREFDLHVLQAATERDGDEQPAGARLDRLAEALEPAVRAGTLVGAGGVGRYAFAHALIRETLYDDLTPGERLRLHRRVAAALERQLHDPLAPGIAELAYHLTIAAPLGDAAKAVACARRAAEAALTALAYEDAAHWYDRALAVADLAETDAAERAELLLALGRAAWRAGDPERAGAVLNSALALARDTDHRAQQAAIALAIGAMHTERGLGDRSLLGILGDALTALGDAEPGLGVRLLARLATGHQYVDPTRQRDLAEQAVARARTIDDPGALASALQALHAALWDADATDQRLALADEIVRLAETTGDRELGLEGRGLRLFDLLERGDAAAADAEIDAYARDAEAIRQPRCRWAARIYRGMQALLQGRFADAEQLAESALVMRQAPSRDPSQFYGAQLFGIRREQDRLGELEGAVERLVQHYPVLVAWRAALAFLYAETGSVDDARRELDHVAGRDFEDVPRDANWVPTLALLADACAALGDRRRAARVYELLRPFAGRNVVIITGVACRGAVDHYLGILAVALGDPDAAAGHFEAALSRHARMHAWPWLAHTQYQYAALLLARGGAEARAAEMLDQAMQAAATLGMTRLARLGRELSARHERRSSGTPPPASPARPEPIVATPMPEAEVESNEGTAVFRCEGAYWTIAFAGRLIRLKDTKGLRGLAFLLQHPGRQFPATQLAEVVGGSGPPAATGERPAVGGAAAERLRALEEELEEAVQFNDLGRIESARQALEAAADELVDALEPPAGPRRGGRDPAEQARINVTKTIGLAVRKIVAEHDALGHYLTTTVITGRLCTYRPDPRSPISWRF